MSALRKLRAILTMGVVSGVFWGTASLLGFAGYQLLKHGTLGPSAAFSATTIIGFVGEFSPTIACSRHDPGTCLPSSVAGAVMSLILLVLLRNASEFSLLGVVVFPVSVFAILGAATGYAISDTAKRGALPKGKRCRTINVSHPEATR